MSPVLCASVWCRADRETGEPRPRQAQCGLLCWQCVDQLRDDAERVAGRYTELSAVLIGKGGGSQRVSGGSHPDLALNEHVVEARETIRAILVALCRVIMDEGISPPDVIAEHERIRVALKLLQERRHRLTTVYRVNLTKVTPRLLLRPYALRGADGSYPHADAIKDIDRQAAALRLVDPEMAAIARYLTNNAETLARHEAADEHARDLRDLATDWRLRAMAHPVSRATEADEERWREAHKRLREAVGLVAGPVGAHVLTLWWGRLIRPGTVRLWAYYGKLERRGKDPSGRTLYEMQDLYAVADDLYGPDKTEEDAA